VGPAASARAARARRSRRGRATSGRRTRESPRTLCWLRRATPHRARHGARSDHGHGFARARVRRLGRAALRLLEGLLLQALALELREIVDEQLAVQVIRL